MASKAIITGRYRKRGYSAWKPKKCPHCGGEFDSRYSKACLDFICLNTRKQP
jgi:hypothetical protein